MLISNFIEIMKKFENDERTKGVNITSVNVTNNEEDSHIIVRFNSHKKIIVDGDIRKLDTTFIRVILKDNPLAQVPEIDTFDGFNKYWEKINLSTPPTMLEE